MLFQNNFYVVIPARYNSSRYPGKPLVKIAGKELLLRVYERCARFFPAEKIYVATDDERIKAFCDSNRLNICMTSPHCLTGTDRVAEFSTKYHADFYINVQGDEPLISRKDLEDVFNAALKNPSLIINGMCDITSSEQFFSSNVPKVVTTLSGKLLYMSRAGVPSNKKNEYHWGKRQVCIYSFPKNALELFSARSTKTPLEEQEDIEILRFLEIGIDVKMIQLSEATFAVDIPEDVKIIEDELRRLGEN